MHQNKHIRVRGEARDQANIRKLGRALIALAQAEAEKAAQAEHQATTKASKPKGSRKDGQV